MTGCHILLILDLMLMDDGEDARNGRMDFNNLLYDVTMYCNDDGMYHQLNRAYVRE